MARTGVTMHEDRRDGPVGGVAGVVHLRVRIGVQVLDVGLMLTHGGGHGHPGAPGVLPVHRSLPVVVLELAVLHRLGIGASGLLGLLLNAAQGHGEAGCRALLVGRLPWTVLFQSLLSIKFFGLLLVQVLGLVYVMVPCP